MGAPLREWVLWTLVALVLTTTAALVMVWPGPVAVRAGVLLLLGAAVFDQAFRRIPAFDPRGRVRWRLPHPSPDAKCCAITFDDGPSASTAAVLDILAAEGVPATFFVLGTHVERFPDLVRRTRAEGHAVGLHGMDHARLTNAPEEAVEAQVCGLTALLNRLGVTPAPVYRTPHGFKSRSVFSVARRRGLTLWAWTRGVWDTDRPDPSLLVRRATRSARSGMVLLLHDGRGDEPHPDVTSMLTALPLILRELKRRGFTFVRLPDV